MEKGRVVIVGAGIGGLTAAIGLRAAGFAVEVHERAAALEPVGAGLTIQPNAISALRKLGVADEIERAGAPIRAGAVMRFDGSALMKMPDALVSELSETLGAGIVGIHRATLHEILLRQLGPQHVHLGSACSGYERVVEHDKERVRVRLSSGEVDGDVLVGADGLRSAVRAQLQGAAEPRYAGYTSFRGVTADRCGLPDDFGGEMWGRGQRFGGCCIDGGRFYWFATLNAAPGEKHASAAAQKAELSARFAHFGLRVPDLIESTPAQAIIRTDISDRPPLTRWGEGPVTLLGDAAHPTTPNLGQGACQAIEDAWVLSRELARAARPAEGLRAYERARCARANAVVITSRRLGAIGQWQNPLACALRDSLFAWTPVSVTKRQLLDAWRLPGG